MQRSILDPSLHLDLDCRASPPFWTICGRPRDYHAHPVPAFGDPAPDLLIVGLAPGCTTPTAAAAPSRDYASVLLSDPAPIRLSKRTFWKCMPMRAASSSSKRKAGNREASAALPAATVARSSASALPSESEAVQLVDENQANAIPPLRKTKAPAHVDAGITRPWTFTTPHTMAAHPVARLRK